MEKVSTESIGKAIFASIESNIPENLESWVRQLCLQIGEVWVTNPTLARKMEHDLKTQFTESDKRNLWVSVEDALPPPKEVVLVWGAKNKDEDSEFCMGFYGHWPFKPTPRWSEAFTELKLEKVTHWQPIAAPVEKKS